MLSHSTPIFPLNSTIQPPTQPPNHPPNHPTTQPHNHTTTQPHNQQVQTNAMQYGIGYQYNHDFSNGTLTQFDMDLGVFLATRGPYSWLGYGWMGCGCGWEHGGKM